MLLWAILPALAVLAVVLVGITVWQSVLQFGSPGLRLERFVRADRPEHWEIAEGIAPWARDHGFEFVGGFRLLIPSTPIVFAWRSNERSEFLCQYHAGGQVHYDIVSVFGPRIAVTTASTEDAFTLPQPPGACVQAFPGLDLDGLWTRHVASREVFAKVLGEPRCNEGGFEAMLLGALRRQAEFVQSLPFWQLRGPWWFFVGRNQKKNRPAPDVYDLAALARTAGVCPSRVAPAEGSVPSREAV